MTFRLRLFLAFAAAVLVPLAAFGWGVRREMEQRLTAQYERRVDALVSVIEDDLARQAASVSGRLAEIESALARDNRFRLAAAQGVESERPYLLDYASQAMRLAGLSLLRIQDEKGRILSSGHFRNEYDRLEPDLPRLLAAAPGGTALVRARTAEAPFLALATVDTLRMGRRVFTLVGGVAVERGFLERLARDRDLAVSLRQPDGLVFPELAPEPAAPQDDPAASGTDSGPRPDRVVAELELPYIATRADGGGEILPARIVVTQSLRELRALRRQLDFWFAIVAGSTLILALLAAAALASRISRPLAELARKTRELDLERLDVDFASDRRDELGALARLLAAMTDRLRAGARRLREAERRAAIGELARQVNHDIKNGLIPIRNVLRHLAQVARGEPHGLASVFREREPTLEAGVAYLEALATSYARLTPRPEARPCEVNAVVREVARNASGRAELRLQLADRLPPVLCDPVALRRILENLVANAVESLEGRPGTVTLSTEPVPDGARIVVADTGRGMSPEEAERAFDDFYTTKEAGTGLGLSIVRRLVRDSGGNVRVETAPGAGSRFIVDLPAADGRTTEPAPTHAEPEEAR